MLNEEDYSKNDFIVVSELQFNVFANVVDNTELRDDTVANPEEPPVDGGNTGDDANDNSSTDGGDNNEPEGGDGIDGVEPDITDPDNVTP